MNTGGLTLDSVEPRHVSDEATAQYLLTNAGITDSLPSSGFQTEFE